MILRLKGKTQKGKNRVRELGNEWELVERRDSVLFSQEKGPWLLVVPVSNPEKPRWIHENNDVDFEIEAA